MPYRNADLVVRSKTEHPLIAKPFDEALAEATRWWPLSPLQLAPRISTQGAMVMTGVAILIIVTLWLFEIAIFKTVLVAFLIFGLVRLGQGLRNGRIRTGARLLAVGFDTRTTDVAWTVIGDIRDTRAVRYVDQLVEIKRRTSKFSSLSSPSRQVDEARYARWIGPYQKLYDIVGSMCTNHYTMIDPSVSLLESLIQGTRTGWGWAGADCLQLSAVKGPPEPGTATRQINTIYRLRAQYLAMVITNRQSGAILSPTCLDEERTVREELRVETAKLYPILEQAEIALERLKAACRDEEPSGSPAHTLNPPT